MSHLPLLTAQTYYVDLDLTTANGGRRAQLKKKKLDVQPEDEGEAGDVGSNAEEAGRLSETPASANAQAGNESRRIAAAVPDTPNPEEPPIDVAGRASDIQILDVHGLHPIVSYQNQIYHCTWSDVVGTTMFFSRAEGGREGEDLVSTDDFHLINTSRIKLIGQKARLTGKAGGKRRRQAEEDSSEPVRPHLDYDEARRGLNGKSLGEIRTSNSKTNADIKRQAVFLETLMDVKRAKGESDNVRTVFSQRKGTSRTTEGQNHEAKRPRPHHAIAEEIEELNRKVVRGDAAALIRLQDIYSSMENDAGTHPLSATNSTGG